MPITTCTSCEKAFDAGSEEYANEPGRLCPDCDAYDQGMKRLIMVRRMEKENAALRSRLSLAEAVVEAAGGLLDYMKIKYPGEELRCPHMIGIQSAYRAYRGDKG